MPEAKNNKIIYHYCSLETFKSIIENKCFWLCDVQKSNDSTELIYLQNKMIESIDKVINSPDYTTPQYDKDLLQQIKNVVQNTEFNTVPVYSCSFSMDEDLLSQWRGYADDGFGVAIGVDCSVFPESVKPLVKIRSIQYGNAIAHQACETMIEYAFSKKDSLPNPKTTLLSLICDFVSLNRAFYKSLSFQEEKEQRIVLPEANKTPISYLPYLSERKYRITHHQLVSYHELRFETIKDDLLCKITLGPKCQTKPDDIRMFLKDCGYRADADDLDIVPSEATYR